MGKKKKNKSKKGKTLKIKKSQPKAPKPSKPKPKPKPKPQPKPQPKPKPKPKPQPKPTKPKSDKPKNKLPKINKDKPKKPKSSKSDKSKDSKKPKSTKPKDSKKPKNKLPKINKDKSETKPKKPKTTKPKDSKKPKTTKPKDSKQPKNKLPKINKGEPKTEPKKPKSNKPKDPKDSGAFNTLGGIYAIGNPKSTKGKTTKGKTTKGKTTVGKTSKGKTTKGKTNKNDLGPGPWAPDYDGKDFKKNEILWKAFLEDKDSVYAKKPSTPQPKKDTTIKDLEKELDLDEKVIKSNDPGPKWDPGKTARNVRNQWKGRLTDSNTEPQRLKIDYKPTGKLGKFSKPDRSFDTNRYIKDFRGKLAQRAKERGLKGNALKAIRASGAQVPKTTPPKYGGVIDDLRNKLGNINYTSKFKKTTDKLTQSITSGSSKYKQIGENILKGKGSEDTALPIAKPRKKKVSPERKAERSPRQRPKPNLGKSDRPSNKPPKKIKRF